MSPERLQVLTSTRDAVTNAITRTAPVITSTALSRPSAKNASALLSGDQNGCDAPSVPASGRGTDEFNGRSQSNSEPFVSEATNASWRPSGESASMLPDVEKIHWSGSNTVNSSAAPGWTECVGAHAVQLIAATTASIAIAAHRRMRPLRRAESDTESVSMGAALTVDASGLATAAIKR